MEDANLAPCFNIDGVEIPNDFNNRAVWARHEFIRRPQDSQIDAHGLVWLQYTDGIWYSIAGNWSRRSPNEKRASEAYRDQECEERLQTAFEIYREVLYQSKIRQAVLDRDENCCRLCGGLGTGPLHIHHILKRREGGTDHFDNLLTVCNKCHGSADGKLYDPGWVRAEAAE